MFSLFISDFEFQQILLKIAGNHRSVEGINTKVAHQDLVSFSSVKKDVL